MIQGAVQQATTADIPAKIGVLVQLNSTSKADGAVHHQNTGAGAGLQVVKGEPIFLYIDNINKIWLATGGTAGNYFWNLAAF